MATPAYRTWVAAGRRYRLATPIAELKARGRAAGVQFLGDLGSDDARHLQADRPQDHTPFPVSPWPVPLPALPGGYVVCAEDWADGPHSDRLLADAKAGRTPWLKYVNFRGRHYDVRDGWAATPSSDTHLHISIRSDWIDRSIGVYNPFVEATVATTATDAHVEATAWRLLDLLTLTSPMPAGHPGGIGRLPLVELLLRLDAAAVADAARDQAVLTAVQALATAGGVDAAPIVAAIHAARDATHADITALQGELVEALGRAGEAEHRAEQYAAALATIRQALTAADAAGG